MFSKLFNINKLRIGYIFDNSEKLFYNAETNTTNNIFTGDAIKGCNLAWDIEPLNFIDTFGDKNRKALRLDNTIRGTFINPIPDGGCILTVGKYNYGATGTRNSTIIKGGLSTVTNPLQQTSFNIQYFSGNAKYNFLPVSSGWNAEIAAVQDIKCIVGLCIDGKNAQSNTIINDGDVVNKIDPAPSTTNNNKYNPSQTREWRMGVLNCLEADASATLDTYDIAAIFFFGGNPLIDQPDEIKELINQINEYYGIF